MKPYIARTTNLIKELHESIEAEQNAEVTTIAHWIHKQISISLLDTTSGIQL